MMVTVATTPQEGAMTTTGILRAATTAALVGLAALTLAGCTPDKPAAKPGEAGVYETIDTTTNCGQLQRIFDSYKDLAWKAISNDDARSDNYRAYMDYANARMGDLHCNG